MSESIQCWQCGTRMTLDELASNDGDCPRCEAEVHLAEYLDNALSKVAALEAELARLRAGQEPVRLWFIGDAGQQKGATYCKKSSRDGSLAFFECEEYAKRAALRHPGTEVYPVEYYRKPQATPQPATVQGVNQQLLEALEHAVSEYEKLPHSLGYEFTHLPSMRAAIAAARKRESACEVCDGTGDVHRPDGEWLGKCPLCDLPARQEGGKA